MSRVVTVIYDDRTPPPADINAVIGAGRFSDILRKRVSLGEEIRRSVVAGNASDLVHLVDERDARNLAELIEASQANRIFLRLPSCLMPTRPGELALAVEKGRYALNSMLLGPPLDGEAAAFLTPADAIPLLRTRGSLELREKVIDLSNATPVMVDHCGFVDLRRPDVFLRFMGDATEARHFNTTLRTSRIFRKASADRVKMAQEYGFFHIVPDSMKRFLVPTFDFQDDGVSAAYSMERLNIPDAALQFIHFAFDEQSFGTLVEQFFDFIATRSTKSVGAAAVRERAGSHILAKMDTRLDAFLATGHGRQLDGLLQVAGPLGGLRVMQDRARALIQEAIRRDQSAALAIGHGDPCFSNILFDRRTSLFRLIDPRGARSLDEAWMHPLYDLAKFSHSAMGGYDFVNNDLFDCSLDEQLRLHLTMNEGGSPRACQDILRAQLDAAGHPLFVVRAYELSLFMSMLPLHADHPRKLAGFALIACQLIQSLEAGR